jgi:hypothetical protein
MTDSNDTTALAFSPYSAVKRATNTLAIVSLVSAFVVSLAAVITGHIALSQIKKTGENGRGLAIAGLILGYAGIAFGFLCIALVILGAAVDAASYTSSSY